MHRDDARCKPHLHLASLLRNIHFAQDKKLLQTAVFYTVIDRDSSCARLALQGLSSWNASANQTGG